MIPAHYFTAAEEDQGVRRIVVEAAAAFTRGDDLPIPESVSAAIEGGEHPVRAVRAWRGLTQAALGAEIGENQAYVAKLEGRRLEGSPRLYLRLVKALGVPLELLVQEGGE